MTMLAPSGADDTPAILRMLASTTDAQLGPGQFNLSGSLALPGDNMRLKGCGQGLTIIRATCDISDGVVSAVGKTNIAVEDLTIDVNNTMFTAALFSDCTRAIMRRVEMMNSKQSLVGIQQGSGNGCVRSGLIDCRISNALHGAVLSLGQENFVSLCQMDGIAWSGVNMAGGYAPKVNDCRIVGDGSGGDGYGGIRCSNSTQNPVVSGNVLIRNRIGLFVLGSSFGTFSGNTITQSRYFGALVQSTPGTDIYCLYNSFVGNTILNPWIGDVGNAKYAFYFTQQPGTYCQGNSAVANTVVDNCNPANATNAIMQDAGMINTFVGNTANIANPNG